MNVYIVEMAEGHWYKLIMEDEVINKIREGFEIHTVEEFYKKRLKLYDNIHIIIYRSEGMNLDTKNIILKRRLTEEEFKKLIGGVNWGVLPWCSITLPHPFSNKVEMYLYMGSKEMLEKKVKEVEKIFKGI